MATFRTTNALLSLHIARNHYHHIPSSLSSELVLFPSLLHHSASSPFTTHSQPSSKRMFTTVHSSQRTEPLHVIVGMSGGVDSSVTAAILKHAGFRVTGVFMKNWDQNDEKGAGLHHSPCPTDQDYLSAKDVTQFLQIPLIYKEFEKEYWKDVFVPWIEEYRKGYTPNPDVWCNRFIKFGVFRRYCLEELQSDCIATGHYSQIYPPIHNPWIDLPIEHRINYSSSPITTKFRYPQLYSAIDGKKDQSDFLSLVPGQGLQKVILPVGCYTKPYVRYLAEHIFKLPSAKRKDSYGICFIGKRPLTNFLEEYIDTIPKGKYINIENQQNLGLCSNALSLTIGQSIKVSGLPCKHYIIHTGIRPREDWKNKVLLLRSSSSRSLPSSSSSSSSSASLLPYQTNSSASAIVPAPVSPSALPNKENTVVPIYVCPGLHHPALYSNAAVIKMKDFNFIDDGMIVMNNMVNASTDETDRSSMNSSRLTVFRHMVNDAIQRYNHIQRTRQEDRTDLSNILSPSMKDIIQSLRNNVETYSSKETSLYPSSVSGTIDVPLKPSVLSWLPILYRDRHNIEQIHRGKVTIIHEMEWIMGWILATQPNITPSELFETYLQQYMPSSATAVPLESSLSRYRILVSFTTPHRAVTPGQTLVLYSANTFYDDDHFSTEKNSPTSPTKHSYPTSKGTSYLAQTIYTVPNTDEQREEYSIKWIGGGRQCYGGGLIEDIGPSWWELGYSGSSVDSVLLGTESSKKCC